MPGTDIHLIRLSFQELPILTKCESFAIWNVLYIHVTVGHNTLYKRANIHIIRDYVSSCCPMVSVIVQSQTFLPSLLLHLPPASKYYNGVSRHDLLSYPVAVYSLVTQHHFV